jgi:hypothetical protein
MWYFAKNFHSHQIGSVLGQEMHKWEKITLKDHLSLITGNDEEGKNLSTWSIFKWHEVYSNDSHDSGLIYNI